MVGVKACMTDNWTYRMQNWECKLGDMSRSHPEASSQPSTSLVCPSNTPAWLQAASAAPAAQPRRAAGAPAGGPAPLRPAAPLLLQLHAGTLPRVLARQPHHEAVPAAPANRQCSKRKQEVVGCCARSSATLVRQFPETEKAHVNAAQRVCALKQAACLQAQVLAGQSRVVLGRTGGMGCQPALRLAPPLLLLRQ